VITASAADVPANASALGTTIGRAAFSNDGTAVDLAGPGNNVLSTRRGGGTELKSGTSMAAPHVAGGAALLIAANPGMTPGDVEAALESSTEDVNNVSSHPEELLNVRGF
jgi:subtilisin family serine protease